MGQKFGQGQSKQLFCPMCCHHRAPDGIRLADGVQAP